MNRSACFILLALCVAYIPAAHAASLKDELLQNYKTRVLALRYPFVHGDQKFDSAGHPLSSPSGAWLVYGGIYIQNVVLSPNMLRLEGPRAALTRPKGNEKPLEAIWVFGVSGDFQEGDPQRHAAFLRGVKMSAICFLAVATEKWVSR